MIAVVRSGSYIQELERGLKSKVVGILYKHFSNRIHGFRAFLNPRKDLRGGV